MTKLFPRLRATHLYLWKSTFIDFFFLIFFVLVKNFEVLKNTLIDNFSHVLPENRSKVIILFLRMTIIRRYAGFNCITMGDLLHENRTSRCFLFRRYPKNAAIISKHFCSLRNQLGENTGSIVIFLPNFILGAINEHIFSY